MSTCAGPTDIQSVSIQKKKRLHLCSLHDGYNICMHAAPAQDRACPVCIQHKPCFKCFCYSVRNRLCTAPNGMLFAGCRQTSYWPSMRSLAASTTRRRLGTPSLLKTPPRSDPPLHPVPGHRTQSTCRVAPSHITASLSCYAAAPSGSFNLNSCCPALLV